MQRHFRCPVVRHIAYPYAMPLCGLGVNRVDPTPYRLTNLSCGSASKTAAVIGAYCTSIASTPAPASMTSSAVLHAVTRSSWPAATRTPASMSSEEYSASVTSAFIGAHLLG